MGLLSINTLTLPPLKHNNLSSIDEIQNLFNKPVDDVTHLQHDSEIKLHALNEKAGDLHLKIKASKHTVKHHFAMYKQNI
jgi:hypothetical protein